VRCLCLMIALQLLLGVAAAQNATEVSSANANEHILKKIDPEYPPLAKAARIQGKVLLKATISTEGDVTSVTAVSGHPMLAPSAIEAVKKWKYKPFLVDGQPMTVTAEIEVPFSLGISEADYKKEQEASNDYFKQEDRCRALIKAQQFTEAEAACKTAVDLVEKLPGSRQMERLSAYRNTGVALFYQRKFSDALGLYQHELSIAQATLKPDEAELGYAYHDVALGLHGTGDLQQARSYYERAETTLDQAREHIDSAFLKNQYSGSIKSVLLDYAVLLRQSGDSSGADAAEQKAKTIVVRTDLKDN
jgi:TonB family protein